MGGSYCYVAGCTSKYGKTTQNDEKTEAVRMFKPPLSLSLRSMEDCC